MPHAANRPGVLPERRRAVGAKEERARFVQLDDLFETRPGTATVYVHIEDQQIELPHSVSRLVHDLVHALARGETVDIVPREHVLTTPEAAAILNISRPTLVQLLDTGVIPSTKVGGSGPGVHRRVRLSDVRAYKDQREADNVSRVSRLITLTENLNLYNDD